MNNSNTFCTDRNVRLRNDAVAGLLGARRLLEIPTLRMANAQGLFFVADAIRVRLNGGTGDFPQAVKSGEGAR